jgi:integrase
MGLRGSGREFSSLSYVAGRLRIIWNSSRSLHQRIFCGSSPRRFLLLQHELPVIGKVRWHDLRHTFGSLKIDQGEDLLYVSRQMGHSSLSVTGEIYAHQIRERRPEAAAKTDAMIFG